MNLSKHQLFSARNLLLILFAVITARASAATLTQSSSLSPAGNLATLQSSDLEQAPSSIIEAFLRGSSPESELELIPIFAERSFIEEVLDGDEYFILTTDLADDTRTWLTYLAPEGLTFDVTMANATISLQSIAARSKASFEGLSSLENPSASSIPAMSEQRITVPYEVFFGIELTQIASSELDRQAFTGRGLPEHSISDFLFADSNSVPEPSSSLLVFLAMTGSLLKRKRS